MVWQVKGLANTFKSLLFGNKRQQGPQNFGLTDYPDWFWKHIAGDVYNQTGLTVTPESAVKVAAVFACVGVIGKTVSGLPIRLIKSNDDGTRQNIIDDPRVRMLRLTPNGEMTASAYKMATACNLALRNNAYTQVLRNVFGNPVWMTPVEPKYVKRQYRNNAKQIVYDVEGLDNPLTQQDLIHFTGVTFDGQKGADITAAGKDAIALAAAIQDSANKFFSNGQRLGTVLESDKTIKPEQRNYLEQKIKEQHSGVGNDYETLVLDGGLKIATGNKESNQDSQFLETKKDVAREIAMFMGVPPHKIGIEGNIPRANAEQIALEFVVDAIGPLCTIIESNFDLRLLTPLEQEQGYGWKFNLNSLLRGDIKTRGEYYMKARQGGWMNVDEIRALEDMNPLPDGKGQIYLEPHNMIEAGTKETES